MKNCDRLLFIFLVLIGICLIPSSVVSHTSNYVISKIWDGVDTMSVYSEGHGNVINHSHIDQGATHMHVDGLGAGTTRYLLVDISDTTNYPHANTTYIHLEWFEVEVDGSAAAEYQVNLGFIENVDSL